MLPQFQFFFFIRKGQTRRVVMWSVVFPQALGKVIYATTDAPLSFVKLLATSGSKICAKVTSWRALQIFQDRGLHDRGLA